ncbi:TPA: amine oxidase [Candidatus Sumerlaeota bacterium]|jgi:protoporphyrinogen oxidase|nr:amine oxidase [Candidatus Sumerlaeota bacterium]
MQSASQQTPFPKILILGAGPTGLGAAYRLLQLNYPNWKIVERNPYPGGLAASFKDSAGFTWDIGTHVPCSHYAEFDQFFNEMTQGDVFEHQKRGYIRLSDRFIPFPLQSNIRHLPPDIFQECYHDLEKVAHRQTSPDRSNFLTWNRERFGDGITRYFIQPDNEKRWAFPLHKLASDWLADRVSPVDLDRIRENIRLGQNNAFWRLYNSFQYPKRGGIGSVFEGMRSRLGVRLELEREVVEIESATRAVWFSDDQYENCDYLLSTLPINKLVQMLTGVPESLLATANQLESSDAYIVGIGLRGSINSDKHWAYCPESVAPFYRATYLTNFSPFNGPDANHSSILCDISHSRYLMRDKDSIVQETIDGLIATGMLQPEDTSRIVSTYLIDVPGVNPLPTLERDGILDMLHGYLEPLGIHSRGRQGAWLYEVGNMDHCVMMGMQWVDAILAGKRETVWLDRR